MKQLTKIVATISEQMANKSTLERLIQGGVSVFRLNSAHQSLATASEVVKTIRSVSESVAVLIDTKGPEIRTTAVEEKFEVFQDQIILVTDDPTGISNKNEIFVNYKGFYEEMPIGKSLLIDDGSVSLKVVSKQNGKLSCIVENPGIIGGRKSINVPGLKLNLPSLSEKDKEFIRFAIENEIDFIAHSFVRKKADLEAIQTLLDQSNSPIKLIAKIENQEGVDNISEILELAYGIMIARGDLGIEIPAQKIPGIQKKLIQTCIEKRKPVIVATQMLHSMITSPRPTRAEVTDVANAVYEGTDAVMLSGETAYGKYPFQAVETMATIALETEKLKPVHNNLPAVPIVNEITAFLCKSAVKGAANLNAKAIVADSMSGRTLRSIAAYRSNIPVYAVCYDKRVVRELALSYGVEAFYMPPRETTDEFLYFALKTLKDSEKVSDEDTIVVVAGNFGSTKGATFIEICKVEASLSLQKYFVEEKKSKQKKESNLKSGSGVQQ